LKGAPLKVLNVMSRFNVGGTSQWLFQLSQGLDKAGIENRLLIGDCPSGEMEDSRLSVIPHNRISGLGPKQSLGATISAFLELRKVIRDYQPDIVNTHTSKAGVIGRLASSPIRTRPTTVHTYHGHVLSGYFNPVLENTIRAIEICLSVITDYFLVSGEQVLEDLKKAKIVRGDKVLNIWPAVPTFPIGNRENLRRIHKIPKEAVVIGWLGRKVPIKRIDRILEIAAQQRELIFVIAGDGDSIHTTYSNFIQRNKLTNIIELGFTSPSEIWAIADICLVTSDNEAMPISPIEASLAGRPIVAVDAGSTREVIVDGTTGILCKRDVNQLSSAIGRLSKDASLRSKMGEAARLFAVEKFSPETSVNRQLEGYRLAITRSSRGN